MALRTINGTGFSSPGSDNWGWTQSIGLALLVLVAIGLRTLGLDHAPTYDEFYHVLAARSWLNDGTFCIADCLAPYTRGSAFTLLVAGSFSVFGESIVAARIPSVVAGVLLVFAVFIWVRSQMSTGSAFVAAGLCAVAPGLIGWSQISRFYAPQVLLVWVAAALFWTALMGQRRLAIRALILAGSLAAFGVSVKLQITTLIPIAGVGVWFVGFLFARRSRVSFRVQHATITVAALILVGVIVWPPSMLVDYWQLFRNSTNLHHVGKVDDLLYYHDWFLRTYSFFYILFPLAILVSVVRKPGPSRFLATIFVVSFAAHSFGGFKGERLILYVFPFFYVLWAIALSEVLPAVVSFVSGLLKKLSWIARRPRTVRMWARGLVTAITLAAAASTEAARTTIRLMTLEDAQWSSDPWYRGNTDWEAVEPDLRRLADNVDVLLSSASIKAIYYFGRSDAEISRTQLYHSSDDSFHSEFWTDWRTGRPVISQAASLKQVVSCYESGLILVDVGHWRNPAGIPSETADAIEAMAEEIPLARGTRAKAFAWHRDESKEDSVCSPEAAGWGRRG